MPYWNPDLPTTNGDEDTFAARYVTFIIHTWVCLLITICVTVFVAGVARVAWLLIEYMWF